MYCFLSVILLYGCFSFSFVAHELTHFYQFGSFSRGAYLGFEFYEGVPTFGLVTAELPFDLTPEIRQQAELEAFTVQAITFLFLFIPTQICLAKYYKGVD